MKSSTKIGHFQHLKGNEFGSESIKEVVAAAGKAETLLIEVDNARCCHRQNDIFA